MTTYPQDHAVVRYSEKHGCPIVFFPYLTTAPNKCPATVVHPSGTYGVQVGILVYNSTRPGNHDLPCRAVHDSISGSKNWRINGEMARTIEFGNSVVPSTPSEN